MINFNKLIELLGDLPGVGKKTAKRLAIKLVENKETSKDTLSKIINTIDTLEIDKETGILIENNNKVFNIDKPLMIVQNNLDAESFRELFLNDFNYFNLNINTIADISRSLITENRIDDLINYIKEKEIKEIIFGLSPKKESEIIINLIVNEILKEIRDIKVSKIATGVPVGGSIEHIDSNTMRKAVDKREKI
jgi:recombination protein RecR